MTNAKGPITIFGYGPTGAATAEVLRNRGQSIRVVQRKRPASLPAGVEFMPCDVMDAQSVLRAMTGAEQAVITIGVEYSGRIWREVWPKAMANFLAAAEAANARIVHIDNMYMYGPHDDTPIHEDAPLTAYGHKPAVRSEITRMWMEAGREGRVKWVPVPALSRHRTPAAAVHSGPDLRSTPPAGRRWLRRWRDHRAGWTCEYGSRRRATAAE